MIFVGTKKIERAFVFLLLVLGLFTGSALVNAEGAVVGKPDSIHLYFIPQTSDVVLGELVRSELWVDTNGKSVNAADITLQFDPTHAVVESAERSGSVFGLWVREPEVLTAVGAVHLVGGAAEPFSGKGILAQVYWRATKPGPVTVGLGAESSILLGDGQGTKAPFVLLPTSYAAVTSDGLPVISSSSHPDEARWYQTAIVRLHWNVQSGAEYSYVVTRNHDDMPDDTSDAPVGDVQLSPLNDGVYYFRLRQRLPNQPWSTTVTHQFKIDATAPDPFTVHVSKNERLFAGRPFASFVATDVMSGVVRYRVQEGTLPPETLTASPYVLRAVRQNVPLRVTAIDRAGNERTVFVAADQTDTLRFAALCIGTLLLAFAAIQLLRGRTKSL